MGAKLPSINKWNGIFHFKTVINGKSYYSNDIRIINEKDPYTPQINSPKTLKKLQHQVFYFLELEEKMQPFIYIPTSIKPWMKQQNLFKQKPRS